MKINVEARLPKEFANALTPQQAEANLRRDLAYRLGQQLVNQYFDQNSVTRDRNDVIAEMELYCLTQQQVKQIYGLLTQLNTNPMYSSLPLRVVEEIEKS